MARKKRQERWVIFARPQVRGGPGNLFFAKDGSTTASHSRAARFFSAESAHEWAKEKGIKLDGAMRYAGIMDFSEWDLREE